MNVSALGVKMFKCPIFPRCKHQAQKWNTIIAHFNKDHPKDKERKRAAKRFICSCDKRYTDLSGLTKHRKAKFHEERKAFYIRVDLSQAYSYVRIRDKIDQMKKRIRMMMLDPCWMGTMMKLGYAVLSDHILRKMPL